MRKSEGRKYLDKADGDSVMAAAMMVTNALRQLALAVRHAGMEAGSVDNALADASIDLADYSMPSERERV